MNTVLEEIKKTIRHGDNAVVCIITDVQGSSPGKTGASMLVTAKGATYGTIGGGALELKCIQKALDVHKSKKSYKEVLQLDKDADMICGGTVSVQYRFLSSDTDIKAVSDILGIEDNPINVFIFGAGHVGLELAPVLRHLDFNVILLDDRENIQSDYILCNYADINSTADIKPKDYVVIMTHGHIADRTVLLQVCKKKPAYVGCIGSEKKVDATRLFLKENKISADIIDSIDSPIGIPLGGDSPAEIAISVAARLIQKRSGYKT